MAYPREIVPIKAEVAGSSSRIQAQQHRIMRHISLISLGDENVATAEPCIVLRVLRHTINNFTAAIYSFNDAISTVEFIYGLSNKKLYHACP
jgi:hypothetical protein